MKFIRDGWNFNKDMLSPSGEPYKTDKRCKLSINDMKKDRFYIMTFKSEKGQSNACICIIKEGQFCMDNGTLWKDRVNMNDLDLRNYSPCETKTPKDMVCLREISFDGFINVEKDIIFDDKEKSLSSYILD